MPLVDILGTAPMKNLLTQLVQELKGMNARLESISADVAVQGSFLVKCRTDQGCKLCRKDVECELAEVGSNGYLEESQDPSMLLYY